MNNIVTPTSDLKLDTGLVSPDASIVQQRQILALMGVDLWAQRQIQTVCVDYDEVYTAHQEQSLAQRQQAHTPVDTGELSPTQGNVPNEQSPVDNNTHGLSEDDSQQQALAPNQPASLDKSSTPSSLGPDPIGTIKRSVDIQDRAVADLDASQSASQRHELSLEQVEPFEIMGVRYKDWVILADVVHLRESQSVSLWENILLGLSVKAQNQKFPICEGITDKESANASVAGFVFRLAQSECDKIIAVTPLPTCLEIDSISYGPYLSQMIEDPDEKRLFWQQINS